MKSLNKVGAVSVFLILCYVFFISINFFVFEKVVNILGVGEYDPSIKEGISDILALLLSLYFARKYYKFVSAREKKAQLFINYPVLLFVGGGVILNLIFFL